MPDDLTHFISPRRFIAAILSFILFSPHAAGAQIQKTAKAASNDSVSAKLDAYLKPYVESGNFSGAVLIKEQGKVVFEKPYGFGNREEKSVNVVDSEFHVASVSMQYTAAAILRLVDSGALALDAHAVEFAPRIKGAEKTTIRDLITERSGLPDINDLPAYNEILQHHQTPESLVGAIEGRDLLFEPGSKFLHEEHSAYNLLALIVEEKTRLPFAQAMKQLVFDPANLRNTFIDDDSATEQLPNAAGYQPEGAFGLRLAPAIHWSGKTGNASVVTTVSDEAKFMEVLLSGPFLSVASRNAMFDAAFPQGYGWFKRENPRFGEAVFYMNGRAPGFASFVLYLPQEKITVVVFSNIYSSATTTIGYDLAAIIRGLAHETFQPRGGLPAAPELKSWAGTFQFGPDFYLRNARISLEPQGKEIDLRWPSGDISPLIPVGTDEFVDRSYWERVKIVRDASGKAAELLYGNFRGSAAPTNPQ